MSSGKRRVSKAAPAERLVEISRRLCREIDPLRFGDPVTLVYNPLAYGQSAHEEYLRRFGNRRGQTILLGMNPGPWGMAQTAVPFGAVKWVRDWMCIENQVEAPALQHPKRPVLGFDSPRNEVSGDRLWGWAAERYGTADAFFEQFFVWNYCPASFMVASGANWIPEKLSKAEREGLYSICDAALREVVSVLEPKMMVGVGKFAADRARLVVGDDVSIGQVLHPSPASPAANRGWAAAAEKQLDELGLL